uniref:Uncharacterized protein n=1 Tax=Hippocampus comes TaxID=109280 RepID=A0A3Q2XGR2_HIPCM
MIFFVCPVISQRPVRGVPVSRPKSAGASVCCAYVGLASATSPCLRWTRHLRVKGGASAWRRRPTVFSPASPMCDS